MAALGAGVALVTAVTSPAALPPTQPQAWASGRYLDGLVVAFFLVGAAVLLRAAPRQVLICAACVVPPTLLAAIVVSVYAGSSVPTSGFGAAFVFAEPAVLTQNWTHGQRAAGHGGGVRAAGGLALVARFPGLAVAGVRACSAPGSGRSAWSPRCR